MTETRIERDSLGEISVPVDALYGAQTMRAVHNFQVSGMKPYRAFVWSMATIKQAAALVHMDLELMDRERGGAIVAAAQEVIEGRWDVEFVVDPFQAGAGTSHNMNTNEVIANRANLILGIEIDNPDRPVHPNDHVNMAQSTNDTIPTAIRLGCLWRLDELTGEVERLAAELRNKAIEFDDVVKSGRTHLQDAVPVRLGQELGGYARAVERDAARMRRAAEGLRRLGIGGTATGTGLNAHPEYQERMVRKLSELTGLKLYESDNLFESMQSMADAVDFSASMRTLAVTLDRIANDFRLLSSGPASGLDEIHLPAVQPGSSIMPGKVNPVMSEMLTMVAAQVIGNDAAITIGGERGNLELNVMIPVMIHNLLESVEIMATGSRTFADKCVSGITANVDVCMRYAETTGSLSTVLVPVIGYDKAAEVAKKSMKEDKTLREVVQEMGLMIA